MFNDVHLCIILKDSEHELRTIRAAHDQSWTAKMGRFSTDGAAVVDEDVPPSSG